MAQPSGPVAARKLSVIIFRTSTLIQVSALTVPGTLAQPVSRPSRSVVRGETRMNGATSPRRIIGVSWRWVCSEPNQAPIEPG